MKVLFEENKKVTFDELKKGEVFYCDNNLYMVIGDIEGSCGYYFNAVNIITGDATEMEDCCLVERADYEFKVKK